MPPAYPADWPAVPSLRVRFAAIWAKSESEQFQESEALLDPYRKALLDKYQEGPTLEWGREAGKTILGWFPGLYRNLIADRLGVHPGHLSRLVNGKTPWTSPLLFAAMEQARRYVATLPLSQRVEVGLHQLPPEPAGPAYRRYARRHAMVFVDHILRKADAARKGKPDAILDEWELELWEYELLDDLLSNHSPEWFRFPWRYDNLAPVFLDDSHLQSLVRDTTLAAARHRCLPNSESEQLEGLLSRISLGYAAADAICRVWNHWQQAWKAVNDYVPQWEQAIVKPPPRRSSGN